MIISRLNWSVFFILLLFRRMPEVTTRSVPKDEKRQTNFVFSLIPGGYGWCGHHALQMRHCLIVVDW